MGMYLHQCSQRKIEEIICIIHYFRHSIRKKLKTMTADNSKELSLYQQVTKGLEIDFYFTDPYNSWQRGMDDNTSGLFQQYLPKGNDLKNYWD